MARDDWGIFLLGRQLEALDEKVAKKLLRKTIRDAAKILAAEVRAKAPVDQGVLKRSVKIRSGRRTKGNISFVVSIEGGREAGFVGFVEFGRRHQPANPFVRQSIAAKRDAIVDEVVAGLTEALS